MPAIGGAGSGPFIVSTTSFSPMEETLMTFLFFANHNLALFWICAVAGTTLFALRMLAAMFGGLFHIDDTEHGTADFYDDAHHDIPSFKIFTLHSLAGFLMIFGWTGLGCATQYEFSPLTALAYASLAGTCMLLITAWLMRQVMRLEGPGTVFSIDKAVGLTATVYQEIPAQGLGKIQITIDNVTRELQARSDDGITIPSFTAIKVVRVIDRETVEVTQLT